MTDNNSLNITDQLIEFYYSKMIENIDLAQIAMQIDRPLSEMQIIYDIVKFESKQTLSLLKGIDIPANARVLEVGAGYGLASICLAMMGFDVTALEPGGIGFEENRLASIAFSELCDVKISHIKSSAEDADFRKLQKFDLVISNNVLEHIGDVNAALSNLNHAILPHGIMIHSCANYKFPYEPHFAKPLIPLFPKATGLLLSKRITNHGVWKSLNFITASQVRRNANKNAMSVHFRKGTMTGSIKRLKEDPAFAERHKFPAKVVANQSLFRTLMFLLSLPVWLATPMDFLICAPDHSSSEQVQNWVRRKSA
jgi:2-polyprenyl-3-methyl-5-hydroxy-6-metoxy-1,4-benzoquinol methylase